MSNGPTPIDPADLPVGNVYPIEPTPEVLAACEEESHAFVESQTWKWLDSTYALQREVYGYDLPLAENTSGMADYVTWNALALVKEVSELTDEVGWKKWAEPRGWVNRENALKEAVDVAHFLANILCAIGVTDDEWVAAYQAKQAVNRERQRAGYDGVTGKCPGCKRSYDDGIDCTPVEESYTVMNASGSEILTVDRPAHCAYKLV